MGILWADQKLLKKRFEVSSSLILHNKNKLLLDRDVRQKVDCIWQPVMTSSVSGPRRSSKALPKAKLAPRKGHGDCFVVCCWSDLLYLFESWWNHYNWEECSASQWDTPKTATSAAGVGQQKGVNSSPRQCLTTYHIINTQKLNKWGIKVLP